MSSLLITSFPEKARAFWPFLNNANAAQMAPITSASTPVLKASTNIDPNPNKGLGAALQTSGGKALLAYSGPSGTIADVASSTSSDRISVYVVRPGDTLSEIAALFNVSVNTVIWANDLRGAGDVHPGDTLIILPVSGIEYTIVKGDTLKSLAKKYGADAEEIAQFNGLSTIGPLVAGTQIIIPGGELGGPTRPSTQQRGTKDPYRGGGGAFLAGYFVNPLPGGILTQGVHGWNAVDIGAPVGTPIYAAANGSVIIARTSGWNGGYGRYIVITHANGTQTVYGHLSNVIVSPGQDVLSGQIIGYVGTSGHVTGPHLHFEVRGARNPFASCAMGSVCSPQ